MDADAVVITADGVRFSGSVADLDPDRLDEVGIELDTPQKLRERAAAFLSRELGGDPSEWLV